MIDARNPFAAMSPEQLVSPDLYRDIESLSDRWSLGQPFPHVVIDNFFRPEVAALLAAAISSIQDDKYRVSFRGLTQRKLQLGNIQGAARDVYPVYEALMGPSFTDVVEGVSGYTGLQADRQFTGAGMQRYYDGGFSEIHLDSNRHPFDSALHHRVNLIVFMNPDWQPQWSGELVLWSHENGRPRQPTVSIQPSFNRGVLFAVTSKSWHSVNTIRSPSGCPRNSLVIYYFNRVAAIDDERPRSVIWHSTHGWARQAVFEVSNRIMTLAKPHARYLRWLRPNKFDGVGAS